MRLAILHTRLSGYLAACLREFKLRSGAELLLYVWPNQPDAPFDVSLFADLGEIRNRREHSDAEIGSAVRAFRPDAILVSGWADKGYVKICKEMRKQGVPVISGCDTQWKGNLRQHLAAMTARFHVQKAIDVLWVTGERQATLGRALGYSGDRLWDGYYACDWARFARRLVAPAARPSVVRGPSSLVDHAPAARLESVVLGPSSLVDHEQARPLPVMSDAITAREQRLAPIKHDQGPRTTDAAQPQNDHGPRTNDAAQPQNDQGPRTTDQGRREATDQGRREAADQGQRTTDCAEGATDAAQPHFLYVGRYVPAKGLDTLAAAYRIYCGQVEAPWGLVCAGAGPLRETLIAAGAEDRGFVQPNALPALMHSASAFILPSRFEPWGVVVHEAAASGLPMILSDACGAGVHLLRDHFNGFSFPTGDAAALAERMVRMTEMEETRREEFGCASFELSKQYTPARWAETLVAALRPSGPLRGRP